jgi:thioesterase domain-containing protein
MPFAEVHVDKNMHVVHREPRLANTASVVPTVYRASSVLLQGNVQASVSNLFLFPGAFGTSDIFERIPPIDPNRVAVFGLTSAFANAPEQLTNVSIPELASLYVAEIQRRQPHGPYSLLGYSIGGIIAYEAARQLIVDREAIERIYLVDSPCPLVISPIRHSLINFIDSTQAKQMESEPQLKASMEPMSSLHETQTLVSFEKYMPKPLSPCPGHPTPKTTYYIAKQGLDFHATINRPDVSEGDQKVMSWMLDDRKGLGATGDGWERLVDRTKLKIVPIDGNHFSIMKEPYVRDMHFVYLLEIIMTDLSLL